MRRCLLALCLLAAPAMAQDVPAPLLPYVADATVGALPLSDEGDPATEQWFGDGALYLFVRNVTRPTLRPVLPDPAVATGAAALVVPGGGFVALDMGNEGMEAARALADAGIAAFVLKYRTEETPSGTAGFAAGVAAGVGAFLAAGPDAAIPGEEAALEDAQAALGLIRERAADWGVDTDRLGILGFSAGAITSLNAVLAGEPVAFAGLLYGRMAAVEPPEGAPPLFVALAADDPLFGAAGFGLIDSWRSAGQPVEFHYYAGGSHGFGMGQRGTTSDSWFTSFLAWLDAGGIL